MAGMKIPVAKDVFERVVFTFLEGAGAVAFADGVGLVDLKGTALWAAAGVAGAGAVLALVKTAFSHWAEGGGGSAFPSVKLAPEPNQGR